MPTASLSAFIAALHDDGTVWVAAAGATAEIHPVELAHWCATSCQSAIAEAPAGTPIPDGDAAYWGFSILYDLCRFTVHRALSDQDIAPARGLAPPSAQDPAVIFGVDVALRHLSAVHQQAAALSADDPLVGRIAALAKSWPLSAVGIPTTGADPGGLLSHPGLSALYIDRIFQRRDRERARHPLVAPLIAAACGGYPTAAADLLQDHP